MSVFIRIMALVFIAATVIPLIKHEYWLIRVFDFPRLQLFVSGFLITISYVITFRDSGLLDILILVLLVSALAYQGYQILRYTPFYPRQVVRSTRQNPGSSISVMVANVLMDNRKADALIDLIRQKNPDIICTVETDDWWENKLRTIEDTYPYTSKAPLDNTYGMLLYSRFPLSATEIRYLLEDGIPSIRTQVELPSGIMVDLYCLHPKPPYPTEATQTTKRDAELLIVGKEVSDDKPTIVMGDLNDVAWSHTTSLFQKISGLLDPRIGRGMYNSYNARNPLLRYPLDHLFHSNHFKLKHIERLPYFGSDHFPILVQLVIESDAEEIQEEPESTPDEREEAEEKIEKGKEQEMKEFL